MTSRVIRMEGRKYRSMEVRKNGRMEEWKDGRMEWPFSASVIHVYTCRSRTELRGPAHQLSGAHAFNYYTHAHC